jgi:hypothetical protein
MYQVNAMANMTRWATPAIASQVKIASGMATEATTAMPSRVMAGHASLPRRTATSTIPRANAIPITLAATEWRVSSTATKGAPGSAGRLEKTAAKIMKTPKAACAARAATLHDATPSVVASTPNPNNTKPPRASHAPCSPCAADSLVVC